MWFFKKKKRASQISPLKQKILDDAKKKMEINYLSPKQIEKIIADNKDVDFLDGEINIALNWPDIEFLSKKLFPQNLKEINNRKNIEAIDIVKAVSVGDIIGYKYEFTPHNYEETMIEELPPSPARFTDDTVLSIATMKAVLNNPQNPDFRTEYIDAYKRNANAGYGSAFVGWALDDERNKTGYHSFGNGCAMRISFIPAYYDNLSDVIRHTIESVMVSHDHIESIKATVVISVCIWMALHNYSKEDIFEYAKIHYMVSEENQSLLVNGWSQFNLDKETSTLSNKESKESLFANYAVPYAIKCFVESDSYEMCMRLILSHFGDTDTICAIAGGLCYAYYGTTGLNTEEILKKGYADKLFN